MLVELKSGIHRQWKHFNRDLKILLKAACVSQSVVFFGGPPGANDLKGIDGQLHVTYHIYIYTKRDIYIYIVMCTLHRHYYLHLYGFG